MSIKLDLNPSSRLEANLDGITRLPRLNELELSKYSSSPTFTYALYSKPWDPFNKPVPPPNFAALINIMESLDIEQDPYVLQCRAHLEQMEKQSAEATAFEQKLAKKIRKG